MKIKVNYIEQKEVLKMVKTVGTDANSNIIHCIVNFGGRSLPF